MQSYSCKPPPPTTREIHIRANYNQQTSNMEEKTTTNEDNDALETPLINGRRESMELEQVSLETNADEPFWLKIVCFLGCVYPILRENGKCKCNWKTVGWSILPLVWTCGLFIWIISNWGSSTFTKVVQGISFSLFLFLPLSLSYTRKQFSDAIVGEENRVYINTVAKRGLMLSVIVGVFIGVIYGVFTGVFAGVIFKITVYSTLLLCLLAVIILRCLFLTRTGVAQVKTELLEMVRGTEVEEVQTKVLEISKMIQEASMGYLQVPLSVVFAFGMLWLVTAGMLIYKNPHYLDIILVIIFGTAIVTPLWLLTRIEKFYLWTLRELLHRNTVMPRTEQTNLLAKYDTIAPRASIFGIYITRGRVASIILAIFGSIAPKIGIYLYQNIGN